MNTDLTTILSLIARHALTTAGGALIAHGYLQSGALNEFVGAGMMIAGVFWSWWQKRGLALLEDEVSRLTKAIMELRKKGMIQTQAPK